MQQNVFFWSLVLGVEVSFRPGSMTGPLTNTVIRKAVVCFAQEERVLMLISVVRVQRIIFVYNALSRSCSSMRTRSLLQELGEVTTCTQRRILWKCKEHDKDGDFDKNHQASKLGNSSKNVIRDFTI